MYVTDLTSAYVVYTYLDGEMQFPLNGPKQYIGLVNNGFTNGLVDSVDYNLLKRPDENVNFNGEFDVTYDKTCWIF